MTIHNNAFLGRRFACVPLSPEHYFVQATAPINLAYRYKVPIIPYTVLEEIPFESYSLTLHEPMETDPQQSLDENIRRIALVSVKRQIEAVAERPDQWMVFKGGQITKPRNGRINRNGM